MVIGHQKGRDTKEKIFRNFGMPRPEGYRKALRLMKLAEKFGMPVFTFVDTPGAYPGIGAEERGQSEAIGRNLYVMAGLRGADHRHRDRRGRLGRRARDRRRRRDAHAAVRDLLGDLARGLRVDPVEERRARRRGGRERWASPPPRLKALGVIDKIVTEPLGGAHRDPAETAKNVKKAIHESLRSLADLSPEQLLERRQERWVNYGKFKELAE